MPDLIELEQWEPGIYQLEQEDLVLGGPDGIDNLQAKQLANRTKYLKAQVEALGTGKQPLDDMLTALAALATSADKTLYFTGPDAPALTPLSAFIRTLLAAVDAAAARTTLGAAPLASPVFTGVPAASTPAAGTNTTQLATTAFVQAAIAALVSSSPSTLDTLNELAAALGDDPNFAGTIAAQLGLKAPLASPALTGNPTAPTPAQFGNDTSLATTEFVKKAGMQVSGLAGYSANATLTEVDVGKYVIASGSGGYTLTLPIGSTVATGLIFIENVGTGNVTIQRQSADQIYGLQAAPTTSFTLGPWDTVILYSTGAGDWNVVGGSINLKTAAVFGASLTGNGYQKLPNGLIFQWGTVTTNASGLATITFPITFPNSGLCFLLQDFGVSVANADVWSGNFISTSQASVASANNAGAAQALSAYYLAIGH